MRSNPRLSLSLFVAVAAALLPIVVFAAPATVVTTTRTIEFHPTAAGVASALSVQRPDGQVVTETFSSGQDPFLKLDGLADGQYSYELRIDADGGPLVQTGSFAIARGVVVSPTAVERPHFKIVPETFFADFVSAAGGVCAGFDCTSSETFGVATAKLKANNTRLEFEDTSTSAGFPATDWQLTANDNFSGGLNKFVIQDLTAGTSPFTVEGAAPNNSLYVAFTGRVGVGTTTPGKNVQINDSVSPTIRMAQSVSPFQTWDIVANNNNYIVRDVNHESDPFIIRTAAPYYSLVVDSTGRIGLGVSAPLYQIHHSSGARLDAGSWINASSRAVKQDIHELDGDAAFDAFKRLEPVTFAYKASPAQTRVGFIAEDVPELVATPDRKGLSSMDIVAVLTKVVQQQQQTIEQLQTRLQRLEQKEQ